MKITLLSIEIMLWYFFNTDEDYPTWDEPSERKIIDELLQKGYLIYSSNTKKCQFLGVHDALLVYVDALKSVPLPTQKTIWVCETANS